MTLYFQDYINLDAKQRFDTFIGELSKTNRTPSYYVDWDKVLNNVKKYELSLHTLNYLVGKEDIYTEALFLFKKQPELVKTIPILLACRETSLDVLKIDNKDDMSFYNLDFNNINTTNIVAYVDFCLESGLLGFLGKGIKKNLVDYVYGVEVGLDSNARKNRSGKVMEAILNRYVTAACERLNLEHKSQASPAYILKEWGVTVPKNEAERNFDEAVFNPITKKLWLIETNYYGGGGSKLKAVAGEFSDLDKLIKDESQNIEFVWVTDGQGWNTSKNPLLEAFYQIDYIFNLGMLKNDFLFNLFQTNNHA